MSTGREKIKKVKWILHILVKINSIVPQFINKRMFVFIRNISGDFGLLLRYIILKNLAKKCGDNVTIHEGVYLKGIKNMILGNNVSIHSMCYIDGTGGLELCNDISIAHASTIMTTSHTWENKDIPIKYNNIIEDPVVIKDNVWIGSGCRILGGVTINSRSIIAAGAVVTKNIESNYIVGGIPARFLKEI